jgi:predicted ATP-dependent protease
MPKTTPLPPEKLRSSLPPESVPLAKSSDVRGRLGSNAYPQPRALQALELALLLSGMEYNVYVAGEPGLGRTFFIRTHLEPRAVELPTPSDWVYLYNFEDADKPLAVPLPAGEGKQLLLALKQLIQTLRREIPARLDQDVHLRRKEKLLKKFHASRETLLSSMEHTASDEGFNVNFDERGGLALMPVIEGKPLSSEEFERLTPDLRKDIRLKSGNIMGPVLNILRRIDKQESELEQRKRSLDIKEAKSVLDEAFTPLLEKFGRHDQLRRFMDHLMEDVLENLEEFLPREIEQEHSGREHSSGGDGFFCRYQANLFVDNAQQKGAPVIVEENPTFYSLLGSIQRETEMGMMYSDFTMLRAGSLHRANGGFLIMNAELLLSNPNAWEGLLRCLRSSRIRLEDPTGPQEGFKTKTLEPDSIPIRVRIILVGTDELYELLLDQEERFGKFFKLKAHLQDWTPRSASSIRSYVRCLAQIAKAENLLPFNRSGLGALVDHSSRLVQDQKKLSLRFPHMREIMLEADALAKMSRAEEVDGALVLQTIRNRDFRSNLYEEEFLHEYDREAIRVPTSGTQSGRAIGLSVSQYGDYVLALPHLISCTVGVGHGGVLDLEREAELGGPIHTKGMMILKSYFLDLFAQDKPLTFTGSLCFEQSYAHVDGDSASGAELAALLSALSSVPLKLSLAFTGAVSQSGAILAVGEVSRKVEGFFQVCQRRGLTGEQGVLIPVDNTAHLMLKDEVVQAVAEGKFSIYPVRSIEQAMEILTGLPAGRRLKKGGFSSGSLYGRVDERLTELAFLAEREVKRKRVRTPKNS